MDYLSEEEKNICAFSPIEILNYYLCYPQQLIIDSNKSSKDIYNYLLEICKNVLKYVKIE